MNKLIEHKVAEDMKIKENTFFFNLHHSVKRGSPVLDKIRQFIKSGDPGILELLKHQGLLLGYSEKHNLIAKAGRTVLARLLSGDNTYTGEITKIGLGSSSSSFTEASTQLHTEVFRTTPDSTSFDNNICYIDTFIEAADVANQTFQEYGTFIDGTVTANSGQAFTLLSTGGWVKSGSMFISSKYTIV